MRFALLFLFFLAFFDRHEVFSAGNNEEAERKNAGIVVAIKPGAPVMGAAPASIPCLPAAAAAGAVGGGGGSGISATAGTSPVGSSPSRNGLIVFAAAAARAAGSSGTAITEGASAASGTRGYSNNSKLVLLHAPVYTPPSSTSSAGVIVEGERKRAGVVAPLPTTVQLFEQAQGPDTIKAELARLQGDYVKFDLERHSYSYDYLSKVANSLARMVSLFHKYKYRPPSKPHTQLVTIIGLTERLRGEVDLKAAPPKTKGLDGHTYFRADFEGRSLDSLVSQKKRLLENIKDVQMQLAFIRNMRADHNAILRVLPSEGFMSPTHKVFTRTFICSDDFSYQYLDLLGPSLECNTIFNDFSRAWEISQKTQSVVEADPVLAVFDKHRAFFGIPPFDMFQAQNYGEDLKVLLEEDQDPLMQFICHMRLAQYDYLMHKGFLYDSDLTPSRRVEVLEDMKSRLEVAKKLLAHLY